MQGLGVLGFGFGVKGSGFSVKLIVVFVLGFLRLGVWI